MGESKITVNDTLNRNDFFELEDDGKTHQVTIELI